MPLIENLCKGGDSIFEFWRENWQSFTLMVKELLVCEYYE